MDVSETGAKTLATECIRSKIASDEIPEFAGIIRRASRREAHGRKFLKANVRTERIHGCLMHMAGYAASLEAIPAERGGYNRMCPVNKTGHISRPHPQGSFCFVFFLLHFKTRVRCWRALCSWQSLGTRKSQFSSALQLESLHVMRQSQR